MPQQYTVPQFIDSESKIIGPITARQFIIMVVAFVILVLAYRLSTLPLFIVFAVVIGGGSAVIAFVRVNGAPFHIFLVNMVTTWKRPGARVWNKELTREELKAYIKRKKEKPEPPTPEPAPRFTQSHLAEVALIVDTGGAYGGEDILKKEERRGQKKALPPELPIS